jgi:Protein of unknown function (DUF1403)
MCASGSNAIGPPTDELKKCPILEAYRTFWLRDKQGGFLATERDKPPHKTHHAPVIRTVGLALLDAFLRADPPAAGALRAGLALQSAAASAKILHLNPDAASLRDLRFSLGDPLAPAATLLSLWRDCASRPPSLDPGRIFDAARGSTSFCRTRTASQ